MKDFEAVEKFYGGKRIPEDEFFLNTLTREFNIPRDRVEVFAKVFLENLKYLRAFSAVPGSAELPGSSGEVSATATPPEKVPSPVVSKEPRIREFLDTCFVMMPFGPWFDRYYQEIYIPGIKEAGFEPVRADELFTTGSVVEQIWEQIEKAKLCLLIFLARIQTYSMSWGWLTLQRNRLFSRLPRSMMCPSTFAIFE